MTRGEAPTDRASGISLEMNDGERKRKKKLAYPLDGSIKLGQRFFCS